MTHHRLSDHKQVVDAIRRLTGRPIARYGAAIFADEGTLAVGVLRALAQYCNSLDQAPFEANILKVGAKRVLIAFVLDEESNG